MITTHKGKFQWEINAEMLPKFKAAKVGEEFKSSEFEIGPSIKWHLECAPNGKVDVDANNCQLYLIISSFPIIFTDIIIFYQLHCAETASNFSGIKSFKKPNDSTVWFRGVFTNAELQNMASTVKTLQFECTINILKIQSKDGKNDFEYPLNIDFNTKNEFVLDWKIKDAMLDKFKAAQHGKFVSDNCIHNDMWSLQCAPNGYRNNDHGSVRLFMQLCALPTGIKSINLTRKLQCIDKDIEREAAKDTPWGYNASAAAAEDKMRQNSGWGRQALLRRDIDHLDEINFRATINIIAYTTNDGEKHMIKKSKSKKRKRSISPAPKTTLTDTKKTNEKMDLDSDEKEKKKDEPPKKKRKTSEKKDKKDKKKKKKKKRKKKSDKSEMSGDEFPDSDVDMGEIKKIECDDKIRGGYEWQLSNDLLNKFQAAKYRKVFKSDEFVVGDLKWVVEVYPSGQNKSDKDTKSVGIFLTMVTPLTATVDAMTVCWTIYNRTTGISYTTLSQYTQKNNSFGICNHILSQDELKKLKNTFAEKVVIGCELVIINCVNKSETDVKAEKTYKQIYPLHIKMNEDGISGANNSEYFNKKCSFEWKIDEPLMKQFKEAYNGKCFESQRFNANMWSLRCAPNGELKEDENKVDLMLQLNSFPKGIGKMKVIFTLKCIETNTRAVLVHNFNHAKSCGSWNNDKLNKSDIDKLNTLTFKAFVHIQMFYDTKFKRIKSLEKN